jgi:hypothetical protein
MHLNLISTRPARLDSLSARLALHNSLHPVHNPQPTTAMVIDHTGDATTVSPSLEEVTGTIVDYPEKINQTYIQTLKWLCTII